MDPREIFSEEEGGDGAPQTRRAFFFSLFFGVAIFLSALFYLATTNAMTLFVAAGSKTLHRMLGVGVASPVAEVALQNRDVFLSPIEKDVTESSASALSGNVFQANLAGVVAKEVKSVAQNKRASEPSPSPQKVSVCDFLKGEDSKHEVILNEIAWMGSVAKSGETSAHASAREWIELKNATTHDISLSGWQLLDSTNKIKIFFGVNDRISARGFFLLERKDDGAVADALADKIYSGSLSNDGAQLQLFDASCALQDEVDASSHGWPAGSNTTKTTLERNSDGALWHTSTVLGGTPKKENSAN